MLVAAALVVAACYGVGAANLYAVAHVALGQLLAAPAVGEETACTGFPNPDYLAFPAGFP